MSIAVNSSTEDLDRKRNKKLKGDAKIHRALTVLGLSSWKDLETGIQIKNDILLLPSMIIKCF